MASHYYTHNQVGQVAALLEEAAQQCPIITLQGPIGAGKTTLIRAFLQALGVQESIVSPTFTYVSCYITKTGRAVYHFDLYRIESREQFESLGFSEYLCEEGALVIIEWPEVINSLLCNQNRCNGVLDYVTDPEQRSFELTISRIQYGS